ncbi:MAG: hypothetical protein FJ387_17400 [Verrucomicrobia bacterium]|nr:hypothetical protein [Verrucomicrobiota bacterium]
MDTRISVRLWLPWCVAAGLGLAPALVSSQEQAEAIFAATGPAPEAKSAAAEFQAVTGARVFAGELGYEVCSQPSATGLALKRLAAPLTQQATFKLKLEPLAANGGRTRNLNGFLAFGDGPEDAQRVKCGIRFKQNNCVIVEGPLKAGSATTARFDRGGAQVIELTVAVSLPAGEVVLSASGQTLTAKLARPLRAITHVGYAVDHAFTAFSPVAIEGR